MGPQPLTYLVSHRTLLRYTGRVTLSYNEVRMRPRDRGRQRTHSFSLLSSPTATPRGRIDYFGNYVHRLDVLRTHEKLEMRMEAVVENSESRRRRLHAWPTGRLDNDPRLEFMLPSPRVPLGAASALAREWIGKDDSPEALIALAEQMRTRFRYVPGATTVESTIDEFIEGGVGVCQDFAHLFIAMVRSAGWPVRYVSGYLGPSGEEKVAIGESHAWAEICSSDGRWVGIDPTNGSFTGTHHLVLAVGRDYGDVAPHRGVFFGAGTGLRPEVTVRVSLMPPQRVTLVQRGAELRYQHEQQQQRSPG